MKLSTAVLASVPLALGACGGASSGLSRGDLAQQANKLCAEGQKQQLAAGPPPRDFRSNPAAASAFLDEYAPIVDGVAAKLMRLKPAAGVKSDWEAFAAKFQQAAQLVDSARIKARNKDASGIKDIRKAAALGPATNDAASKVGATTCAK